MLYSHTERRVVGYNCLVFQHAIQFSNIGVQLCSKHFVSIYILLLPDVSKDKYYHGSIIQLFVMVMIYSSSYSSQNVAFLDRNHYIRSKWKCFIQGYLHSLVYRIKGFVFECTDIFHHSSSPVVLTFWRHMLLPYSKHVQHNTFFLIMALFAKVAFTADLCCLTFRGQFKNFTQLKMPKKIEFAGAIHCCLCKP